MTASDNFRFFSTDCRPGERVFGYKTIGYMAANTEMRVGYGIVRGERPGPVVVLISALHGWEPMGTEMIRRAVQAVDTAELSGTIVSIPMANAFSMEFGGTAESSGLQVSPADSLNLNRVFPGKEKYGWGTEQLAYRLAGEITRVADVVVDLHDGTSSNNMIPLCTFMACEEELGYPAGLTEATLELAKAMGTQVGRRRTGTPPGGSSLGSTCSARGIVSLVLSVGGLGMVDENVDEGVRCLQNVLKAKGMIEGEMAPPPFQVFCTNEQHQVLYTSAGGFFFPAPAVGLGAVVEKDQPLGQVIDPLTSEIREVLTAPFKGVIGMFRERMVTNPGGMLGHLASTENYFWAAKLPS
ncbi:MAG: succinylglutamate desuccinylase/aspartoacylase family protein [Thermaerobacterales bacterium]